MKKILFDLYSAQSKSGQCAGGFEFVFAIFKELVKHHKTDIELEVFYNYKFELYEWIKELIDNRGIKAFDVRDRHEIYNLCEEEGIDVFYSGMPYQYTFKFASDKVVKIGSFHGLREYEMPDDIYDYKYNDYPTMKRILKRFYAEWQNIPCVKEKRWNKCREKSVKKMSEAMSQFDKITCESYHSKYAFYQVMGAQYKNIKVFYAPEKVRSKVSVASDGKYILVTMCGRFRKNVYRVLQAINELQKKGFLKEHKTVVTGVISNSIKQEFKDNDRIEYVEGYLETEELEKLYANCSIFVFASMNEGFGYPPLEAMAYGKTCVVGANTSMPEVCGDAVYYVNVIDNVELQTRILEAVERPIDVDKVLNRYNYILQKQRESLISICDFIIGQDG